MKVTGILVFIHLINKLTCTSLLLHVIHIIMEYIKTNQTYILKAGIELCSEILAVTLIFIQLLKIFTKYEQLYNFNFCP